MENNLKQKIFMMWKDYIKSRQTFYEIQEEFYEEQEYAAKSGMDSVYWCPNCKYGICDDH